MTIPLGVAAGVLFIIPLLIIAETQNKEIVLRYALLSSILVLAAFFLSPDGGTSWQVLFNRSLSLLAIWSITLLSIRSLKSIKKLSQLSKAIEQSVEASIITDTKGNIEYVNYAFTQITGYSKEEVIAQKPSILNSGKNPPEVYKDMWSTLLAKKTWRGELINKKKSGELFSILLTISPILNQNGKIVNYISTELDISERREASRKLDHSENRYKSLIDVAPLCIHEIDEKGKLSSMNPAGLQMMGVQHEKEVIGLEYCKIPRESKKIQELMKQAFNGNATFFEFSALNNSQITYYESNFIPVMSEDNKTVKSLMGVSQNITERKLAENKLKDALFLAESGIKVKNEFMSIISHELRTPLNGIVGGIELMKMGVDQGEALSLMEESSQRMRTTLEAILSFITVSKGSVKVEKTDICLAHLQQSLAKRMEVSPLFLNKSTSIIISWNDWQGEFVTDCKLVEIVLWNLLSNALKFTTEGEIKIVATLTDKLTIDVHDTGKGISEDKQSKLFEVFEIAEPVLQRHNEGLGLGLALCKKYATVLGGDICLIKSKEEEGSHFRLTLL